jgi:hypothetical protein
MTIDERIARNIIKAQIASDSGKDIENRTGAKNQVARGPERFGYDAKTFRSHSTRHTTKCLMR